MVVQTLDADAVDDGDFVIGENEKILVKSGAKITVGGDFKIDGLVECQDGGFNAEVGGSLIVSNDITCNRTEEVFKIEEIPLGLNIVARKGLMISEQATIVSNSHVQIVDSPEKLASTADEIMKLYDEAARDTGDGLRIGPFIEESKISQINTWSTGTRATKNKSRIDLVRNFFFKNLEAAEEEPETCVVALGCFQMSGTWVIGDPSVRPPRELRITAPPEDVDRILINFNFGPGQQMNFQNFTLYGPDGRAGDDDISQNCKAVGTNGRDAMRMLARAGRITINNFTLHLGNGGRGGNAETKRDCQEARATGGNGGVPGNFKIMAADRFRVIGAFNIYPGDGGNGGMAIAYGKNGEDGFLSGVSGGNVAVTAGNGTANIKNLRSAGNIRGLNLVEVMSARGGNGGNGVAVGGNGGNGLDCPSGSWGGHGGRGGNASAAGGNGGNAELNILGVSAVSFGGIGGSATARPGNGGTGGRCQWVGEVYLSGGNGGNGGNATVAQAGVGGTGTVPGNDGTAGAGRPSGVGGENGLNLCRPETQTEDVPTIPTETPLAPTPTPTPKGKIPVVRYQDKFIPLSQLYSTVGEECNQIQHWHATTGTVTATDGTVFVDPGGCGFGTISEREVEEIGAP